MPIAEISKAQVGPFHTNTKAGLALARKLLVHRKNPNKQIFMITDGKPSAIWDHGRLYKNPYGLDLKIVNRTLEEADACRRDGITITTFMIATDSRSRGVSSRAPRTGWRTRSSRARETASGS